MNSIHVRLVKEGVIEVFEIVKVEIGSSEDKQYIALNKMSNIIEEMN